MKSTRSDLQYLSVRYLESGMCTPAPLFNDTGRVLVPSGTVITPELLSRLQRQTLFVNSEWPIEAGATPVGTFENNDQPAPQLDKGNNDRSTVVDHDDVLPSAERQSSPWRTRLEIELYEYSLGIERRRDAVVDTLTLSKTGFQFVFRGFVHIGTLIRVRMPGSINKPNLRGVVIACVKLEGSLHQVDVDFTL